LSNDFIDVIMFEDFSCIIGYFSIGHFDECWPNDISYEKSKIHISGSSISCGEFIWCDEYTYAL
jgi:hypothetical protein